jgi:polyhydroxyalkanoate synthesis regulator protein
MGVYADFGYAAYQPKMPVYKEYNRTDLLHIAFLKAVKAHYGSGMMSQNSKEIELSSILVNLYNSKIYEPEFTNFQNANLNINWEKFQDEVAIEKGKVVIPTNDKRYILDTTTISELTLDKLHELVMAHINNETDKIKTLEADKDVKPVLDRYFPVSK